MSDCIEWTGGTNRDGYGRTTYQGRRRLAHRVAFFERHGYWPNICRHICDNPPCVNVDHLLDGTHADNTRDMMERGRQVSTPKLSAEQSAEAVAAYACGNVSLAELGSRYGVDPTTIRYAVLKAEVAPRSHNWHGGAARALSPQQEGEVAEAYAAGGVSMRLLANRYGVQPSTIHRAIHQPKKAS